MYYNHVYFYTCDVLRTCRELWYLLVALVDGKKKESMDCSTPLQLLCQLLE